MNVFTTVDLAILSNLIAREFVCELIVNCNCLCFISIRITFDARMVLAYEFML